MNILDEMNNVLGERIRESESKQRNIDLIFYHYGFVDSSWPTQEETAERGGFTAGERARQIVNKYFRSITTAEDLPTLHSLYEMIASRDYWVWSELEERIRESDMAGGAFNIHRLFDLMSDLKMPNDYETYTPMLERATRRSMVKYREHFVIRKTEYRRVKQLFDKARKFPGLRGIAKYEYLEQKDGDYKAYKHLITNLLKHIDSVWVRESEGTIWYLFEDMDNTLINNTKKLFGVTNECEADRLASALYNSLRRRGSPKYAYPSEQLIKDYLENSMHFEVTDDQIRFTSETDGVLSQIELDLLEYFATNDSGEYPAIRAFLSYRGHSKPNIDKAVFNSPFLFKDETGGRTNYEFSLVGLRTSSPATGAQSVDRYSMYLHRLKQLGSTDEPAESKVRKEQSILRQWLFEGKDLAECGICGKTYSVNALIAAHKKKRNECNEAERLNPYIVMPMCQFGCDFVYEHQHIFIQDGAIQEGVPLPYDGAEGKYVQDLIGRTVADQWLRGRDHYFHKVAST